MRGGYAESCNECQTGNQEGFKATKWFIEHFRATRGRWHTGWGGRPTAGIIHQKCLLGANAGALGRQCLKKQRDTPREDLQPLRLLLHPHDQGKSFVYNDSHSGIVQSFSGLRKMSRLRLDPLDLWKSRQNIVEMNGFLVGAE